MKRIVAFFMAATLVLTTAEPLLRMDIEAAAQRPTMSYPGKAGVSEDVIQGSSFDIKISNTRDSSFNSADPLRISDKNNLQVNTAFTAAAAASSDPMEFPVTAHGTAGYPTEGQYTILSNHATLVNQGSALVTDAPSGSLAGNSGGRLELVDSENIPVMSTSRVHLAYKDGKFTILSSTGKFQDWDTVTTISSLRVEGDAKNQEVIGLSFSNTNTASRANFKYYPGVRYSKMVTDPVTGVETRQEVYNLEDGSKVELRLDYVESNSLFLNVYTPAKVLQDQINSVTAETNNQQVTFLGRYDDFHFLTDNVKLPGELTFAREPIKLKWFWAPASTGPWTEIEPNQPKEKTFDVRTQRSQHQDGINLYLKVEADFTNNAIKAVPGYDSINRQKTIEVQIQGTGTPSVMTKVEYQTGSTTTSFTAPDNEFPSQLTMDVFQENVTGYVKNAEGPWRAKFNMKAGEGLKHPKKIRITATGSVMDSVRLDFQQFMTSETFTFSSNKTVYEYPRELGEGENLTFELIAQKAGSLVLTFDFMIDMNGTLVADESSRKTLALTIKDTSPRKVARLTAADITYTAEIGGVPKTFPLKSIGRSDLETPRDYGVIEVPFSAKKVTLTPAPDIAAWTDPIMGIMVEEQRQSGWVQVSSEVWNPADYENKWGDNPLGPWDQPSLDYYGTNFLKKQKQLEIHPAGDDSGNGAIDPERLVRVTIKTKAQNPNIITEYQFILKRLPKSSDTTLKELKLRDAKKMTTDYLEGIFNPALRTYELNVPFSVDKLLVHYVTNHLAAQVSLDGVTEENGKPYLLVPYQDIDHRSATMTATVTAEDGSEEDYAVTVHREPPNDDATLSGLLLRNAERPNAPLTFTPVFNQDTETYSLEIPYSVKAIQISATPTDVNVEGIRLKNTQLPEEDPNRILDLEAGKFSSAVEIVPETEDGRPHQLEIEVTAEDGLVANADGSTPNINATKKTYTLEIYRALPNTDSMLSSLVITDSKAKTNIDYEFAYDLFEYRIDVPYEVEEITITPTARFEHATIKVLNNDMTVENGKASRVIKPVNWTPLEVEVTAEDGVTKSVYKITIIRAAPSTDARLIDLQVASATDFKPVFAPSRTAYTATVAEGAKGVTITATVNDPKATLTIDGKRATSGVASPVINILEERQKIEVVVTAQDHVTKKTYTITFYNPNLVEKSSNADLKNLTVNYGVMTPKFQRSVTQYEITTNEETYSVEIIPKPADKLAEVKVYAGTKEIGDESGNYAQAIEDGENEFTVQVTSPDKTKVKEYELIVYRNEEDKLKTLRPVMADDIDFEQESPIIVDISKYSRVSAEVFEVLKTYPEKELVLQGNDYSLTFKGKDLKKIIPHTEVYDFGLSYSSPLEDEIWDEIDSLRGNDRIKAIMVYFKHHGELPAPATLTLSLKDKYRNRKLYWHYYNEERERIDYYGYVNTNSRGTFTLPLDHMSTYILTYPHRIYGAENKSFLQGGTLGDEDGIALDRTVKKAVPNTGRGGVHP